MTGLEKIETSRIVQNRSVQSMYIRGCSLGLLTTDGVSRMYHGVNELLHLYKRNFLPWKWRKFHRNTSDHDVTFISVKTLNHVVYLQLLYKCYRHFKNFVFMQCLKWRHIYIYRERERDVASIFMYRKKFSSETEETFYKIRHCMLH